MSLGSFGLQNNDRDRRGLGVVVASLLILAVPGLAFAQEVFVQTGIYTGNGASSFTVTGLHFSPELVIVTSANGRRSIVKTADMPDGESKKLDDHKALEQDRILTLEPDGFTVGTNDEVNKDSEEYYWIAMKSVAGTVEIGSYVGDGNVLRAVPLTGIFPDAALIIPAGDDLPVYRTTDMGFWEAYSLDDTGELSGTIGWFDNDELHVGNSHSVNESGKIYYYATWSGAPEAIEFGAYPGNDQPGRDISGLTMTPEYVIVTNNGGAPPVHRPASLTGDASLFFLNQPIQNNLIQAMWEGGFQVGDDNSVNNGGDGYYWLAFANPGLQADLQVEMAASDLTPSEMQIISIDVTVTNNGPDGVTGLEVTDLLPAGLTLQTASVSRGVYSAGTGIWDIGTMGALMVETLTLTARIDAGTGGGTIINEASVTNSDVNDPNNTNDRAQVDFTITSAFGADLQVIKTVDDSNPSEGDLVTYVVSVTNNGPDDATGVTITDALPNTLTPENDIPSQGSYVPGTGAWDVSTVNVGQTHTLTLEARVKNGTSGQTITNTASVTAADQFDPNTANNSDSVEVEVGAADMQVLKLVDDPSPTENATITYTVIATNLGPAPASGVTISDLLPAGVSFQSATPTVGSYDDMTGLWTIDSMAVSNTQTLTIVATVDALTVGNTITNTAAVGSLNQADTNAVNDSASVDITVVPSGSADLALSHEIDTTSPNVSDTVTYAVVVRNAGPGGASGIEVTNLLPPEVVFVGAMTNKGDYDEITGLWTIGDLENGFQAELNVQATVTAAAIGTTISHTAGITAVDQTDPDNSDDSAEAGFTVSASDLGVNVAVDNSSPAVGDTVAIDVMITNSGPNPATGIEVADLLPDGLALVSASPALGSYNAVAGVWTVGGLNPSLGSLLTIEAVVLPPSAGTEIINNATLTADQADPDGGNNSASVSIFVDGTDLALSLVSDTATTDEEAEVTLTLNIVNDGPQDATGITVTQLLPSGLSLVTATPSQGSYLAGTGAWTVNDLVLGASATLELLLSVDTGTAGTVIGNLATITAALPLDPNPVNDSAAVDITVNPIAGVDLDLSHTIDVPSPNVGNIVTYTVTVHNPGPNAATGIVVTDVLPPEVDFVAALTNKGDYDESTGLWTIGNLAAGFQTEMNVQALVTPAAIGTTVSHLASISAVDQTDPDSANNSAVASFVALTSDLFVNLGVDDASPAVGQTVTYDVMIGNSGPDPATGVAVSILLPDGLSLVSASPALGTYDDVAGVWTVGDLIPALSSFMTIEAVVLTPSAGTGVTTNAAITADQADPNGSDNSASISITVDGTDLALALVSDTAVTEEEAEVTLTLSLTNEGPQDATGVTVTQLIPGGLSLVRATPSQGNYLTGSGEWTVNDLALGDSATLELLLSVDTGTAGTVIGILAAITAGLPLDLNPENDTATVSITVWTSVPNDENILWPLVGGPTTVWPGASEKGDVLTFSFVNQSSLPDTLRSLTLSNLTAGAGTRDQMDREWQSLTITRVDARRSFEGLLPAPVNVSFVDGRALFSNLNWAVPAGDTLTIAVRGSASLEARDAAQLTAGIKLPGDLKFKNPYTLIGNWPLVSGQVLEVDGFVAAQATVVEREGGLLAIGSERNLALTVELPGNGYLDDTLYSFSLANRGSAEPVTDIALVEIWADNYDLIFDPVTDTLLGPATFADGLWRLTGLNGEIPADGRYFYATVNIADSGRPEKNIRFSLPVGNSDAVEMYSGNDGPVDMALENPNTLGISAKDRIILTAEWFPSGVALPGAQDVPLMQFVLSNTYDDLRQLQELTVTNTSLAAAATPDQRDNLCQQVTLRLDGNNNGVLDDLGVDGLLGSGSFVDDKVTFSSLNLDLLPEDPEMRTETAKRLFVLADLGLMAVADGNRVTAEITSNVDISIDHSVAVATWPLRADTEWLINGMTAAQIMTDDISVLTLGPGEGPVLAMDLTVPANGYASDELSGIEFFNEGSATATDIAVAELWADGGNGVFDAGLDGGDDNPLGPLSVAGDLWTSNILSRPVPTVGLRLFASLTVAETPQDSVTVKLGLQKNGITVVSGNDGPLDESVQGRSTLVISTSPLRTAVTFAADATNTGQSGVLNMTVRNAGSEAVTDIVPALNFVTGEGLLAIGTLTPASITTLEPGQETAFSWSFVSSLPGEAVMEGNAQGFVNGDQVRRSIVTPTSSHRIHTPVPGLELYPTANLPFSINQGQQGLVPLNLTLRNTGDADVANAEMTSLRLRFLEAADGPVVVPADLLERIVISEGTNVYFDSDSTSVINIGNDIELPFSESAIVTGAEPVTLGLRLDLRLNSPVPSFLISIENADWLVANDVIDDSDVAVSYADGVFPVRTGQAILVSPATGLNVAIGTLDPVNAVPGQTEILLTEINLSQSGTNDNSSSIDVGRLAFTFRDGNGDPLTDPGQWFTNLSLRSAFQEHFAGLPVVESDSVLVMPLSAPVTISGTATLVLRLVGDIATDSPLGQITAVLASVDYFDARDGNMNNPVPVTLATGPAGPALMVLGPALAVSVGGTGMMPAQVSQGTRDLTALDLTLTNPGAPGTSAATVDTIVLRFFNANRQALDPGPYLDRLRIMRDGAAIGMLVDPVAAGGVIPVPVAGGDLTPGAGADLRVSLDFKPDSPTGTIEVVLGVDDILAVDAITGESLELIAAPGTSLPLSSGVATLVVPAEELTIDAASLMPPLLAPQTEICAVFSFELANPATAGAGAIELTSLTLVQDMAKASDPVLGQLLAEVQLRHGDRIVARTTDLDAAATSVTLVPDSLLTVAADEEITLIAEIMVHGDAPQGPLQLMLQEDGVAAGPPGGEGLDIRVLPASGRAFPFMTEIGHVGGASLSDSYANFPNPFAAGREPTTFAFSLQQQARVDLRIMTPHGELVATILQDDSRPPGLYQNDIWLGLNGNGSPVHNGVYLAELVVKYSDGSRERILRKVAVVR